MLHDIRFGLRLLWKDRGYALTAVLTLAICLGANTAVFTIVNSVLLKPLPVPDSNRILLMSNLYPNAGTAAAHSVNSGVPDYYDRLRALSVFEEQAMYNGANFSIDIDSSPQLTHGMAATPSLFRLLRVPPAQGRIFDDSEGEIGNEQKVILSYGLWQQLYGGKSEAVNQPIRLGGRPFTIVGVMPQSFQFEDPEARFWVPLAFTAQQKSDDARHSNSWYNIGRLKPGATIEQAQAEVNALNNANLERFPQYKQLLINAGFRTHVDRLQDILVRDVRPTLYLLWGGADPGFADRRSEPREPDARQSERPDEGTFHAARSRRGPGAAGAAACDREPDAFPCGRRRGRADGSRHPSDVAGNRSGPPASCRRNSYRCRRCRGSARAVTGRRHFDRPGSGCTDGPYQRQHGVA